MPLPAERRSEPRFDGRYVDATGASVVRFFRGQTLTIGDESGAWSIEDGELRITSHSWDCEGALGIDRLLLLASPGGDHRSREEWVLEFAADGAVTQSR